MKKILCAALTAFLLLASGCQSPDPAPTAPSPAPDAVSSPTASEQNGPTAELPDFIAGFTFIQAQALDLDAGEMRYNSCALDDIRRTQLKELLDMEHWQEASGVPEEMELDGRYFLIDEKGRTLTLDIWDEDFCLALGKEGNDAFLYFAPANVLSVFNDYVSGLTYLPDFVTDFQIDRIQLDHTPADHGDSYLDYAVYLLDEARQAAYLEALAPESWTDVTDFPAVSYYGYSRSYDLSGNRVDVDPWSEEHCLINCFPAEGGVHRYWAPLSVLDNVRAFIESLTPLGYIDYTAKEYYELFRSDFGFDCMMEIANSDGSISDDQMAAYVIETMAYAGLYDYDTGISVEDFNEITQKHFGKTIQNFENSKSKYVEGGDRVTATGWDVPFGVYPVLAGEPQEDENGVITARFLCYTLWESLWLDGEFDQFKLDHRTEYLLTGHSEDFPEPQMVEIVFEDKFDISTQTSYVVYHSIKVTA